MVNSRLEFASGLENEISPEGGNVEIPFRTNADYTVTVAEGSDWLKSAAVSRGEMRDALVFVTRANYANDFNAYIPLYGKMDCFVDWGDGCIEWYKYENSWGNPVVSHTYGFGEIKNYEVKISGYVESLNSSELPLHTVTEIKQWGDVGLTSMEYAFRDNELIKSVPADVCEGLGMVGSFNYAFFDNCTGLTSVPEGLFDYCREVTSFSSLFRECENLTSVPADIFDNNRRVLNFQYTFYKCVRLAGESPYTLIDGKKYHLYERYTDRDQFEKTENYNFCFYECNMLSDKDAIPREWRIN